jgi:ATP-binding cassette subfamily F protein uup
MSLPLFYFKKLYLTFAQAPLFVDISAQISAKEIICLVGKNGSGKSTLLKLMAGEIEPDKGELYYAPNTRIGYLPQQPIITKDLSILEYVMQNIPLRSHETLEEKHYLADIILEKLKLSKDKLLSKISGGQLRRADLARVLITDPDLLFLDEPTNHLDIPSIEWLEEYLKMFNGGVVVVSHDRSFLRNISNKTIWLDRGKLICNNRGYNDFERWSEEVFTQEARELNKLGKELDKENLWLQQGVTARRKRNQQRLASLYELRETLKNEKSRFNSINSSMTLDSINSTNKAKLLVEIEDVSFSFTDVNPPKLVLKPFSLRILKGETIGVMGRNGAVKSTLVKLLTGSLNPSYGRIKFGTNLEYSYIDQSRSGIDPEKTLWETLCPNGGDTIFLANKTKHVIAYLKDFLFDSKQANAKVSTLSGGEQNRLLLAKLLINPGNFLILDEPTNDLDIDTLDMLVEILSDYKGSLLIVSHDRDFLDRLATRTIVIDQPDIYEFVGRYHDYLQAEKQRQKPLIAPHIAQDKSRKEKTVTKLSYKDERELSLLPEQIKSLTKIIGAAELELSNPDLYHQNQEQFIILTQKITKTKEDLEKLEMRWLELEELKLLIN